MICSRQGVLRVFIYCGSFSLLWDCLFVSQDVMVCHRFVTVFVVLAAPPDTASSVISVHEL